MDWLATVMDRTDPRTLPTTEYVFNDTRRQLSHLVTELTFADYGDAATICGLVVTTADLFPNFDLCDDCTSKDH